MMKMIREYTSKKIYLVRYMCALKTVEGYCYAGSVNDARKIIKERNAAFSNVTIWKVEELYNYDFSVFLKAYMFSNSLRQKDMISILFDVDKNTFSRWFNGVGCPSDSTVKLVLYRLFTIDVDNYREGG